MTLRGASVGAAITVALAACQHPATRPVGVFAKVDSMPYYEFTTAATDTLPLGNAAAAFALSDGRIVIADSTEKIVRIIDTAANRIINVGRRGDGPGEFKSVAWVGQCRSDSIFAWDPIRAKLSVFSANGAYSRDLPVGGVNWRVRCGRDAGRIVVVRTAQYEGVPVSATPQYAAVVFYSYTGDSVASVRHLQVGQSRLLGPLTQVEARDSQLFAGFADSFVVHRYGLNGQPLSDLHVAGNLVPAADSDYQRELHQMLKFYGKDSTKIEPTIRRVYASAPRPASLPAYHAMMIDDRGRVWLELSRPGQAVKRWRVASESATLGDVTMPTGFRVLYVRDSSLVGNLESDTGDEHLAAFRFHVH